ncbi:UbiA family prenyltransferase [Candidatus Poribacteria bacterium]|nr:UbiA family prenyltransferase [Candidatus Poribacteria bacterium]
MSLSRNTRTFLEMIKFSHSVFALPFALISMLVAAKGWPGFGTLLLIVVAVVAARTAAMCFNRIADREFDARNPRTSNRALVTGALSTDFTFAVFLGAVLVFFFAAAMLNFLCLLLAAPCLAVLIGYSYTKRFTDYSHLVLGAALGLAPVGAWIAVTGELAWTPLILGAAVTLWVAGFDILYACQDYEVDLRESELHSMPKRLGLRRAMKLARRVHGGALAGFFLFWWAAAPPLGLPFLLGVAAAGAAMLYEHNLVRPADLSRINAAFFTMNGLISIGLFLIACVDI